MCFIKQNHIYIFSLFNPKTKPMKKSLKNLVYLLIAVPILFIGCKKSEIDSSNPNSKNAKIGTVYCGTVLNVNMYDAHASTGGDQYGILTVGNDATNLHITYTLNAGSNYFINGIIYYVGPESDLPVPSGGSYNFTDWAGFTQQWFETGGKANTVAIDLSTLPDCFVIVAFARISLSTTIITNDPTLAYISARPETKNHYGHYIPYCKQYCTCETAYAFGGNLATCLTALPDVNANNWGWSNKITGPVETIHWPIYAGAGQCDISKGTLVGYLDGSYVGGVLNLTYYMNPPFRYSEIHLWVGLTYLPMKKGKYLTAPGQFGYTNASYTGTIATPFYIAAHSVVCGPYK